MLPPPGFVPTAVSSSSTLTDVVLLSASVSSTPTLLPTSATALSSSLIASATLISASATPSQGSGSSPKDDDGAGECQLLGPFALFIQGALGLLAMLSLVWKRYRERPQRPVKIWAFDVSKQIVGSVLVHVANLLMSMLSAGQFTVKPKASGASGSSDSRPDEQYRPNPCSFYLLNLAIDTTVGIPILIILLRLLTYGFSLTPFGQPPESIQSGIYGHPPKTYWWFKQSIIYFLGLLGMKTCVLFIFSILPWISRVGDWALKWTEGNEMVQVFFVMLLFPVIMNAIQYYIIDSFIKDQSPTTHEPIPSHTDDDSTSGADHDLDGPATADGHEPYPEADDEADDTVATEAKRVEKADDETAGGATPRSDQSSRSARLRQPEGYDPSTDGEDSPTVAGSGASNGEDGPLLSNGKGNGRNARRAGRQLERQGPGDEVGLG